jgi:hypothetical protein
MTDFKTTQVRDHRRNIGQVMPDTAQFENLLHSSRLVFSDVFPEEVVEVATTYPAQFSRLCELVGPRQFQRI